MAGSRLGTLTLIILTKFFTVLHSTLVSAVSLGGGVRFGDDVDFEGRVGGVSIITLLTLAAMPIYNRSLLTERTPISRQVGSLSALTMSRCQLVRSQRGPSTRLCRSFSGGCTRGTAALPRHCHVSLHRFYVPASDHIIADGFNCHTDFNHRRGNVSVGICVNSSVRTTFSNGIHVMECSHNNCNGFVMVHRGGNLRAVCNRLSRRLISRGRRMETKRMVNLNNGANEDANSRLRFRAHLYNMTLGPTLFFSFEGRSIANSFCGFGHSACRDRCTRTGTTHNGVNGNNCAQRRMGNNRINECAADTSNRGLCRGMGTNRALVDVTRGHNIDMRRVYHLGNCHGSGGLSPKRVVHCSWVADGLVCGRGESGRFIVLVSFFIYVCCVFSDSRCVGPGGHGASFEFTAADDDEEVTGPACSTHSVGLSPNLQPMVAS